jgi:hypothetical protein
VTLFVDMMSPGALGELDEDVLSRDRQGRPDPSPPLTCDQTPASGLSISINQAVRIPRGPPPLCLRPPRRVLTACLSQLNLVVEVREEDGIASIVIMKL